jgi:hypothetical protein
MFVDGKGWKTSFWQKVLLVEGITYQEINKLFEKRAVQ